MTAADAAAGSRTVLVTFLGSIVRRLDNWLPVGGTVELMTQVGLDAASVRTAVFRLKRRGWLESKAHGSARGYELTKVALDALDAGDEVIWHARQPAELRDGWCIVNFSVPETERSRRDQLRAHLGSLGFGNVGTAMWIAPARMRSSAEQAIAELGLTSFAVVFEGAWVGGQGLRELAQRSWDLDLINDRYSQFIARFQDGNDTHDDASAFVSYLHLVDQWRRLPFRDPGLPRELLPDDWHATEAAQLFSRLVRRFEPRALRHAALRWPGDYSRGAATSR